MSKYWDEWEKLSSDNAEDICCPYCNTPQSLEGPDVGYEQDSETEHTCQSYDCEKKFTIIAQVSYSWDTKIPDEEAMEMLKKELQEAKSE